jgi:hypothetical protein
LNKTCIEFDPQWMAVLEHFQEKARPGLDPGWNSVFRPSKQQTKNAGAVFVSSQGEPAFMRRRGSSLIDLIEPQAGNQNAARALPIQGAWIYILELPRCVRSIFVQRPRLR